MEFGFVLSVWWIAITLCLRTQQFNIDLFSVIRLKLTYTAWKILPMLIIYYVIYRVQENCGGNWVQRNFLHHHKNWCDMPEMGPRLTSQNRVEWWPCRNAWEGIGRSEWVLLSEITLLSHSVSFESREVALLWVSWGQWHFIGFVFQKTTAETLTKNLRVPGATPRIPTRDGSTVVSPRAKVNAHKKLCLSCRTMQMGVCPSLEIQKHFAGDSMYFLFDRM